jgi:anti-anti-sigma factor
VIGLGVLPGVAIAIAFALIMVLVRIYKPYDAILGRVPGLGDFNDIKLSSESETPEGIVVWRFEAPVVFFNADYFKTRAVEVALSQPSARWFVLSMESISQMDSTGLQALEDLQQELNSHGVKLLLVRPQSYMLKFRELPDVNERFSKADVFSSIQAALDSVNAKSAY